VASYVQSDSNGIITDYTHIITSAQVYIILHSWKDEPRKVIPVIQVPILIH